MNIITTLLKCTTSYSTLKIYLSFYHSLCFKLLLLYFIWYLYGKDYLILQCPIKLHQKKSETFFLLVKSNDCCCACCIWEECNVDCGLGIEIKNDGQSWVKLLHKSPKCQSSISITLYFINIQHLVTFLDIKDLSIYSMPWPLVIILHINL